jgi:hypothetical protein
MGEKKSFPEIEGVKKEQEMLKNMSCSELSTYLDEHWESLSGGRRAYVSFLMVDKGCQEVVPYLLRQLESECPDYRWRALSGLEELGRREYRPHFVKLHLSDPDDGVRQTALIKLSTLFRNERDIEILRMALAAWDDPTSSVGMRLCAGAAMMYQLAVPHDERGAPAWWDEENEHELEHPSILRAVEQTRQLLAETTPGP